MSEAAPMVAAIRAELGARAAGYWRREGEALALEAFETADDLATDVAAAFAEATRRVPLARADLGIVRALATAVPAVTVAAEEPAEGGSGKWLRAFGAACSIAVPLADDAGGLVAVLSVALPARPVEPGEVVTRIRKAGGEILGIRQDD